MAIRGANELPAVDLITPIRSIDKRKDTKRQGDVSLVPFLRLSKITRNGEMHIQACQEVKTVMDVVLQ